MSQAHAGYLFTGCDEATKGEDVAFDVLALHLIVHLADRVKHASFATCRDEGVVSDQGRCCVAKGGPSLALHHTKHLQGTLCLATPLTRTQQGVVGHSVGLHSCSPHAYTV